MNRRSLGNVLHRYKGGEQLWPHLLRGTHTGMMIDAGISKAQVKEWGDWSSESMVDLYSGITLNERTEKTGLAMTELFAKKEPKHDSV